MVEMLLAERPNGDLAVFNVVDLAGATGLSSGLPSASSATGASCRIIIFTSGTTGNPRARPLVRVVSLQPRHV